MYNNKSHLSISVRWWPGHYYLRKHQLAKYCYNTDTRRALPYEYCCYGVVACRPHAQYVTFRLMFRSDKNMKYHTINITNNDKRYTAAKISLFQNTSFDGEKLSLRDSFTNFFLVVLVAFRSRAQDGGLWGAHRATTTYTHGKQRPAYFQEAKSPDNHLPSFSGHVGGIIF